MNENTELKGLSGLLILVGIGTVISPFRILIASLMGFIPIFRDNTWAMLTTVDSGMYNPLLSKVLIGEIAFNSIMFTAAIVQIVLFFSKHRLFPKIYITIIITSAVMIPFDAWLVSLAIPNTSVFNPENAREFIQTLLAGTIWIPYMIFSKRVKATFVESFRREI